MERKQREGAICLAGGMPANFMEPLNHDLAGEVFGMHVRKGARDT
jgi:hypothetical protein